ncbi:MAG: hypothetical protein ABJE95_19640 [Byssovorax sp.]
MSTRTTTKLQGYVTLRKLIAGLRAVGNGAASKRGLDRFATFINGMMVGQLERHVDTGLALGTAETAVDSSAINITLQKYRRYIPGFSWRKGTPLAVLKRGQKILAEELAAVMGGK